MRHFLAALVLCLMAFPALAQPRSHHHPVRHHRHHHHHHVRVHVASVQRAERVTCDERGCSDWSARKPYTVNHRTGDIRIGMTGNSLVMEARAHLGATARQLGLHRTSLWCATFMNYVLERAGLRGTGSDLARSFASYGSRVGGPAIGAIAVMARRGGGHVGIVSGLDGSGNPIIISGNHGHAVREAVYPRGRVYAYVMPS